MDVAKASPISTALQGIKRETERMAENAAKVAGFANTSNSPGTTELTESLLEINQSIRQVEALTKVIKVTEEMEDEVLNIIA